MRKRSRTRLASLTLIDIAAGAALSTLPLAAASAQGLPAANWTGYYIGAHVGYRWGVADFSAAPHIVESPASNEGEVATFPGANRTFNADSAFGGAHFGYNWQINPNWLFGLEGDLSYGRNKAQSVVTGALVDTTGDGFVFRQNSDLTLTWQSTLRARAGWVTQSSLWYVTGGAAFARVKWRNEWFAIDPDGSEPPSTRTSYSTNNTTRLGWVVGAGFEQMMAPNWTWRVEYLYEDFGSFDVGQGFNSTGKFDLAVHKVRVGITIKTP